MATEERHEGGGVRRIEARWERLASERERDEEDGVALWAAEVEAARREEFVLRPAAEVVVEEDAPHYAPKLERKWLKERRLERAKKVLGMSLPWTPAMSSLPRTGV